MALSIKSPGTGLWSLPCDLDLGSGQGHISMHNTHRTTSVPDHVTENCTFLGYLVCQFGMELKTDDWLW